MIGFKDNQDVLSSAVRWGLACSNCYGNGCLENVGGKMVCVECIKARESDTKENDAQKNKET